jgi:hypothetical protein
VGPNLNPYFKLIDVHQMVVVPATSGVRYVTLSYVWGNQVSITALLDQTQSGKLAKIVSLFP